MLVLLSGLRYGIGYDYFEYENIFNNVNFESLWLEPGYLFLNILVKNLGMGFQTVIFISAYITCFFVFRTIQRDSDDKPLSILLFVFMGFYFMSFNIIRQCLAMSFIFYSYNYYITKSYGKFALFYLVALSFHFSVIFIFPFLWLAKRRYSSTCMFFIWGSSLVFILLNNVFDVVPFAYAILSYFVGEYGHYFLSVMGERHNLWTLKLLIPNLIAIVLICKWKNAMFNKNFMLINLYMMYIVLFNVFFGIPLFTRVLAYLEIFALLAVPVFLNNFNFRSKRIVSTILIFYYLSVVIIASLIMGQYTIVPYSVKLSM